MPDPSRRGFLYSAAAASLAAGGGAADADDPFRNNVPDPVASGKDLPTFKFELEKSAGRVDGDSSGKEATVEQLPISKGLAGVSMRLAPGAARELHWHATAAEWAFVLDGHCRTTVVGPTGAAETNDFGPGDVWYFPRGHGHVIQCLGDRPTHFILIFDNGYFSEFGTFSVTDWLGHAPPALVAKSLGLPAAAVRGMPKAEVYFSHGPVPAASPAPHAGGLRTPPATHKYRLMAQEPHAVYPGGKEWRVGAEQFPISTTITGIVLDLEPGALRELHWHPNADEWQYVISGTVTVTLFGSHGRFRTEVLNAGDVGYIPRGYGHSIENTGTKPARVLIAFNSGHYEAIDLSVWLAGTPDDLLGANLGLPPDAVAKLPRSRVFIAGGK